MTEKYRIKGTVSVISSEPPCKDCNVQFTTVPLTLKSDKNVKDFDVFLTREVEMSVNFFIISYRQEMRKSLFQRNHK